MTPVTAPRTWAVRLPAGWTVDNLLAAPSWRLASAEMAVHDAAHVLSSTGAIEAEMHVTAVSPDGPATCQITRRYQPEGAVASVTVLDETHAVKLVKGTWIITHTKREVMTTGPSEAALVDRWHRERA